MHVTRTHNETKKFVKTKLNNRLTSPPRFQIFRTPTTETATAPGEHFVSAKAQIKLCCFKTKMKIFYALSTADLCADLYVSDAVYIFYLLPAY